MNAEDMSTGDRLVQVETGKHVLFVRHQNETVDDAGCALTSVSEVPNGDPKSIGVQVHYNDLEAYDEEKHGEWQGPVSARKPFWSAESLVRVELRGVPRENRFGVYTHAAGKALRAWEGANDIVPAATQYRGRGRMVNLYEAEDGAKVIAWLETQDFDRVEDCRDES